MIDNVARLIRRWRLLAGVAFALLALWALVSFAQGPGLGSAVPWLLIGMGLGAWRLYRRR